MMRNLLVLGFGICSLTINAASQDIAFSQRLLATDDECQKFVADLPKDYVKGFIEVPEDWSLPSIGADFQSHSATRSLRQNAR